MRTKPALASLLVGVFLGALISYLCFIYVIKAGLAGYGFALVGGLSGMKCTPFFRPEV